MKRALGLVCVLVLGLSHSIDASVTSQNQEAKGLEAIVRKFWRSLGAVDVEAMKQTIDYPFTIRQLII